MTKIIEFPQLSNLDKQYIELENQQKLINDQKQLIKQIEEQKENIYENVFNRYMYINNLQGSDT